MKNLLACLAILAAFSVTAQVDGFQLPYNPDAQPDGYIGAADVVELLTYYGQTFTPDGIYVNADSTHVLMDMGSMTYPECEYTCQFTLPGSWRLSTLADLGAAWQEARDADAWISVKDKDLGVFTGNALTAWHSDNNFSYSAGTNSAKVNSTQGCFCATHERPKVEYSYCYAVAEGSDPTPFQTCANQKVSEGWYPAGGISSFSDESTGLKKASQAFWRWAE